MSSDDHWIDLAVEAGQLREAMATRPMIDVAKGIIMAARRCSADEAFDELRTASSRSNVRIAELARAMTRYVGMPPSPLPVDESALDPADIAAIRWLRGLGVHPADDASGQRADTRDRADAP